MLISPNNTSTKVNVRVKDVENIYKKKSHPLGNRLMDGIFYLTLITSMCYLTIAWSCVWLLIYLLISDTPE